MLARLSARNGNAVLSVDDCKAHLRITHTDEDALIGTLRDAAIAKVEQGAGVALAQGDFLWTISRFSGPIRLPVRPVIEVLSVAYEGDDGAITYEGWRLVGGKVLPALGDCWPATRGSVAVEFSAGLLDPSDEPDLMELVLRLLVHSYDNRSAEIPRGLTNEILSHRQVLI